MYIGFMFDSLKLYLKITSRSLDIDGQSCGTLILPTDFHNEQKAIILENYTSLKRALSSVTTEMFPT